MTIAFTIAFAVLALATLLWGCVSHCRQLAFLRDARRVQGRVVNEWRLRMYGNGMRYYRVEVTLSTGQRVQLRSTFASSASTPTVGATVPVFLVERVGQGPRAKIGTWTELWLSSTVLLFIGSMGVVTTAFAATQVFAFVWWPG